MAASTEPGTAAHPNLAESLIANLIDNAIRHNLPGGQADITTALTSTGTVMTVGNTGTLIPRTRSTTSSSRSGSSASSGSATGKDTDSAWPSSAPSPTPTAPPSSRAPAPRRPRHRSDLPLTSTAQRANSPDVTAQITKVPHIKHTDLVA
jgi:hypothetical protein